MAGILYLVTLIIVFATIGRCSTPRREQVSLRAWSLHDLWANTCRGLAVLSQYGPTYMTPQSAPISGNTWDRPDFP